MLERVNELSKEKGVSKINAFVDSGVGKNFECNITAGSVPSIEKLFLLSRYFEVTTDYLLGLSDVPTATPPTGNDRATLKKDERELLDGYKFLNNQGKEYIKQQLFMALNTFRPDLHTEIARELAVLGHEVAKSRMSEHQDVVK